MSFKPIKVETRLRPRPRRQPIGDVPARVVRALGADARDKLVWEEGCAATVDRAALKGTYFVVRLERAPLVATAEQPAQTTQPASVSAPPLDSFAEYVRSRRA